MHNLICLSKNTPLPVLTRGGVEIENTEYHIITGHSGSGFEWEMCQKKSAYGKYYGWLSRRGRCVCERTMDNHKLRC